jgi:hypothetical protein
MRRPDAQAGAESSASQAPPRRGTWSGCRCWTALRQATARDGTIFSLPDTSVQLEIVRSTEPVVRTDRIDTLVFYLPDA